MSDLQKKRFDPVFYVIFAVLLWSTGGLFIKLTTLDAYQVTFFRSLLAGLTVLIITRKNGLKINFFGIVASVIYGTMLFLFVWATKHTTAANAIFLQYTAPIYILIFSPFVIGEKFHVRDLVTIVFCIGGMSLFFVGKLELTDYQGNIAALGSGIFLGLYIMLLKHPKATGVKGAMPPAAPDAAVSSSDPPADNAEMEAGLVGEVVLSSDPRPINTVITVIYGNLLLALVTLPSGVAAVPRMTAMDLGAVAFLGIVQIGFAYILFIKGVTGGTRPLDASIIGFIEPLLNPVWVFLFVGEQPSKWAILGGAIIIATVAAHTVVQYRNRSRVLA